MEIRTVDTVREYKEGEHTMIKLHNVFDKALEIVNQVEQNAEVIKADDSQENLTGAQKKAMAVDLLNACIDIPMLPEFVEKKIFTSVVGLIIEFAVYVSNKFKLFVATKKAEKAAKAAATAGA